MRKYFVYVTLSYSIAATPAPATNENLARVAILEFSDQTGSKDYQYLSSSIALGVDKSMKERFDYNPIPAETAKQRTVNIVSDRGLSKDNARQAASAAEADVVIGGSYSLASGGNKMHIRVAIYLTSTDQYIELPEFTNPVDGTIFQAIDKVSEKIIAKIKEIASRQQTQTQDSNAKISLQRTAETSWRDKNFEGVFYINILKDYKNKLADNGSGGMLGALFRKNFDAVPWLHWGLNATIFYYSYSSPTSTTLLGVTSITNATSTAIGTTFEGLLGPHLILTDRLKLFADFMVGYSPAFSYNAVNLKFGSASGYTLASKFGLQLLIGKYFGLDVFGSYTYMDGLSGTAFLGGGLAITLAP